LLFKRLSEPFLKAQRWISNLQMIIPYLFHVLVHTAPPLDFTAPHVVTAHVVRRVAMGSYGIEASVEGVVQELRVQH
jgi:hypothetical protein